MEYRPQEVKAGLMIIMSLLIFIAFVMAISGLRLFDHTKHYIVRFKHTSGLEQGSPVRYGGLEVGHIKDVHIYEKNNSLIEFLLEINMETPVKVNSEATITSFGIMSEFHINISTGHPDSALLPSGSLLKCKDIPSFNQLFEPINAIAENLNETLYEVRQLFSSQNQKEVREIFLNLNKLLADNHKTIASLMGNINNAIVDLDKLTAKIDNLLITNESNISSSVKHLEETLVQTKKLMENFDQMIIDLDNTVLNKGNNLNEIIDNLERTTSNLEKFSRSIKEKPWQLIRKSAPEERKIK